MSNVLTISDLTTALAAKQDITKKAAREQLDAVIGLITDTVVAGDTVRVTGFGSFEVKEREARTGRNPQTGETLEIPASKTVKFKPAPALKAAVTGETAAE